MDINNWYNTLAIKNISNIHVCHNMYYLISIYLTLLILKIVKMKYIIKKNSTMKDKDTNISHNHYAQYIC